MRCSSTAHSSTALCGKAVATSRSSGRRRCLEVGLRLGVSVDMAWTRHPQTCAEPPQINPAQLTADRSPQALRHPGGDGAPVPAVVLRSRSAQRCTQLCVVRHGQQLSMWPRQTPLVFDAVWSTPVVAARDLADPVGGIAREVGNGFGGEAARQEPQELPVTALDWILGSCGTEYRVHLRSGGV